MKVKFFLLLMILFINASVLAQEKTISGTVTDKSEPLPGVSVLIKGTNQGTETDFDGKYQINAKNGDILVFRYLSFNTVERTVGLSSSINVSMTENNTVLDEIVVVGYGTQSKRKLTDNVVKLSSKDIDGIPTPNVFNTISGKAAGVQVNQTNGKVEGGLNFRIRGQSSISAGTNPLFVLDGIPLISDDESNNGAPTNPLLTLSPNEIESIDILKDASSAAIYGARGANGVVIITTKQGKSGKAKLNVNLSNGFSSPAGSRDWLNADQYIELFTEAAANGLAFGGWPGPGFVEGRFDRYSNGTWKERTYDTDWESLALVKGHTRDYDFSLSGGNAKTTYFFSGAYNDTKGIVRGNELNRVNARLNIKHQLSKRLSTGMNMSFSITNIDRIANDNAFVTPLQAIAQSPISPAFVDGEPFAGTVYANFLLQDKHSFFNTKIRRVTGKVFGKLEILPELSFNSDLAYDLYDQTENSFTGRLAPFQSTNGQAFASDVLTENFIYSNYFTFNKEFGVDNDLSVVGGMELTKSRRRFSSVTGTQFPTDDFQTINSAAEITVGQGSLTAYSFVGYFLRATFSLKDRYFLKASIRRDGSSRFGKDSRFGTFPAVSAGWIVSNEDFLANNDIVSFLKLRASWGRVGNAEIGNFPSRGLFQGVSYNQKPGLAPTQPSNKELSWESSEQTDVALEFGFLDGRISGEVAYYEKNTDDLLLNVPLPGSSGVPDVLGLPGGINKNIGEITNKGLEFTLQTKNIQTENFSWSTNLNLGQNNNKIKSLPNKNDIIAGQNILREGEVINAFYLIEYAGVDSTNGDALYYKNTDTNGVLDKSTTNDPNLASRIVTGNPFPTLVGGLTNTLTYKKFDLNFTLQGEWGASIYNGAGRFQSTSASWFDNQTVDQLNRWQKPGDITDVPQARLGYTNGAGHSTRFLQESDFIRLRNVTLGYNIPKSLTQKSGIQNIRLYLSGFNLLTITDYDGYDPETRSDAGGVGQIFYSAPAAKTYSVGVNITF
ncbi:TonB-linked SusC/RagA family outer membrane protein [Lutibacter sp. Hel_I_33_5]|uniref:SusC/RagA family TonB-linked outer membrane protein n=1 Tax=Lutibacter sp. Hel_I_33_5 TaxID=1566289 RepID=UPI0011A7AB70|nr:TonB-dependent receptor [Lutibacter sp. Hel_I_33_5]TVZ57149.1 TonB-linked SusC/RagA family outer membrane protein [Lutibacter sp. Hel_I_33_5]